MSPGDVIYYQYFPKQMRCGFAACVFRAGFSSEGSELSMRVSLWCTCTQNEASLFLDDIFNFSESCVASVKLYVLLELPKSLSFCVSTDGCQSWEFQSLRSLSFTRLNKNLSPPFPCFTVKITQRVFSVTPNLCRREDGDNGWTFLWDVQISIRAPLPRCARQTTGSRIYRGEAFACLFVRPHCRWSIRCAVNACPGNRTGVKEKSWGAGSELLAGVLCWAGCAVCFCSEADRERQNGEGEEQGERSRVDAIHCLSKKICSCFLNAPFRKQGGCIFSFPSPFLLFENKSCAPYHGQGVFVGLRKPFRHFDSV